MEYCVSGALLSALLEMCPGRAAEVHSDALCSPVGMNTPQFIHWSVADGLGISSRGRDTSCVLVDVCQSCRWE